MFPAMEGSAPTWLVVWWACLQLTPIWQTWMQGDFLEMEWCSLDFPISSVEISELAWEWVLEETLVRTWLSINHSINLLNLSLILRLIQLTKVDLVQALLHSRRTVSKSWARNQSRLKTKRDRESSPNCSTSQTLKLRIANMKNPNTTSATTLNLSKIQPLN